MSDFDPQKFAAVISARNIIENEYEWRNWTWNMPKFTPPENIIMQVIPPFGGAIARMVFIHPKDEDISVSVYFDAYAELGAMNNWYTGEPTPYWEIYPNIDGDNERFIVTEDEDETNEMIQAVVQSLRSQYNATL